jgi:hypothetical protein
VVSPTVISPPVVYPSPGFSTQPTYPSPGFSQVTQPNYPSHGFQPVTQPTFPSISFPSNPMFPITTPGFAIPSVGMGRTLVPIHRYWNNSVSDHFYTSSMNEHTHQYTAEGVAFQLAAAPAPGLVPVYRYFRADVHDHFYTTNSAEIGVAAPGAVGKFGYRCEGVLGYISPVQTPGTVPVYRYFKAGTNDHLYTSNVSEIGVVVNGATGNHGYTCEGVLGYAFM